MEEENWMIKMHKDEYAEMAKNADVSESAELACSMPSVDHAAECSACCEEMPNFECPNSKRPCGHHCNHSWSHDACCWCGAEFGEA